MKKTIEPMFLSPAVCVLVKDDELRSQYVNVNKGEAAFEIRYGGSNKLQNCVVGTDVNQQSYWMIKKGPETSEDSWIYFNEIDKNFVLPTRKDRGTVNGPYSGQIEADCSFDFTVEPLCERLVLSNGQVVSEYHVTVSPDSGLQELHFFALYIWESASFAVMSGDAYQCKIESMEDDKGDPDEVAPLLMDWFNENWIEKAEENFLNRYEEAVKEVQRMKQLAKTYGIELPEYKDGVKVEPQPYYVYLLKKSIRSEEVLFRKVSTDLKESVAFYRGVRLGTNLNFDGTVKLFKGPMFPDEPDRKPTPQEYRDAHHDIGKECKLPLCGTGDRPTVTVVCGDAHESIEDVSKWDNETLAQMYQRGFEFEDAYCDSRYFIRRFDDRDLSVSPHVGLNNLVFYRENDIYEEAYESM